MVGNPPIARGCAAHHCAHHRALLSALSWRLWELQGLYLSLCDWALPAARFCPWQLLLGRRCSLRDVLPRRWFQPGSTEMLPRRWQVWNSPACGRCHVYRDKLAFRSSMTFHTAVSPGSGRCCGCSS